MEVTVRKASREDYTGLRELLDEVDALHREHLPHIFQKPEEAEQERDHYLGLLADENVGFFVASAGERLAGFVQVVVKDTPPMPMLVRRRYAVVDEIVVRSGLQAQGIGSLLMDQAQVWALAEGATSIELNVYEFNEGAIAFYEKLGYDTLSRKMHKELAGQAPEVTWASGA